MTQCGTTAFWNPSSIGRNRWASMIRATSKNRVPWAAQRNPQGLFRAFLLDTPAIENGGHGNPASSTSCSGMPSTLTFLMSSAISWWQAKLDQ